MLKFRLFVIFLVVFLAGLLVSCGEGNKGNPSAPISITKPTANAGSDQTAAVGATVVLDGTSSSAADGKTLTFHWVLQTKPSGSQAALSDSASPKPSFKIDQAGTYTVSLTVSDANNSESDPDTVQISTVNSAPVANAGPDQTAKLNQSITLDGAASSDVDGDALSFHWQLTSKPENSLALLSDETSIRPTFTTDQPGDYVARLVVNDGKADSEPDFITIHLSNSPPVANAGPDQRAAVGASIKLDGTRSTDLDGDPLAYQWALSSVPSNSQAILANPTTPSPTFNVDKAGTYIAQLTVNDGQVDSAPSTVRVSTENGRPVAQAGDDQTIAVGQLVVLNGSHSTDPDGDALVYEWSILSKPVGSHASLSGAMSSQPSFTADVSGVFVIQLIVNDGTLASKPDTTVASTSNSRPVAVPKAPSSVVVNSTVNLDASSSRDVDNDTLTYQWAMLIKPTGSAAQLSDATLVNPHFDADKTGSYVVQLVVEDGALSSEPVTLNIEVTNSAQSNLPTAQAGPDQHVNIADVVTLDGSSSTGTANAVLTYQWTILQKPGTSAAVLSDAHAAKPQFTVDLDGSYVIQLVVTENGVASSPDTVTVTTAPKPTIANFSPKSGPIATLVTIQGANFKPVANTQPVVMLTAKAGGTISAPVTSFDDTSIKFTVPAGLASGPVKVEVGSQAVTSADAFELVASKNFALLAGNTTATVIRGYTTAFNVNLISATNFGQLATLTLTGLPVGMQASFKPTTITAGQQTVLTLKAAKNQPTGANKLTVTATAQVEGLVVSSSVDLQLSVEDVTTSFLGRTVISDNQQTPLGGVTVSFIGKDPQGKDTGCHASTVADAAGNFAFSNLPLNCYGLQLIRYNGLTATNVGDYAGVDLQYNIVPNQVTESPVLIHLPRIDNADTVYVKQNASVDQHFVYPTIQNMDVTVYAGTTLSMPDGSQPDPFPLIAIEIPIDRLPDQMPPNNEGVDPFIVAFQPANATASKPVAVSFPNILNQSPGTNVALNTLDPTKGVMVPYGTGKISDDGTKIIPDFDPAYPGHRFGIVHFDWHGPFIDLLKSLFNPSPQTCPAKKGNPVDLASGLENFVVTDMVLAGGRGGVAIQRGYRTLSAEVGPFGIGSYHNYFYRLDTATPQSQSVINLIMPDGNRFRFNKGDDGTFINTTVPQVRGAKMAIVSNGEVDLRWKDGTVFHFKPNSRTVNSDLHGISDPNGNQITFVRKSSTNFNVIDEVIDPVGRKLVLAYDTNNRVTSITDPLGRKVSYAYNVQGTLKSVTNAENKVTNYEYDGFNRLTKKTNARGVVVTQNAYDANGRVIEQTRADGGKWKFSYQLLNPGVPRSPVQATSVTDPNGNQEVYRFNVEGFTLDMTDAMGRVHIKTCQAGTNLTRSLTSPTSRVGSQSFEYDERGNTTSVTDASGHTSHFEYDPRFNRVTKIIDALNQETRFTYDTNGNLLTVIDANGNATSVGSDLFGSPKEITDALGNKFSVDYDSFGNAKVAIDPLGNQSAMRYDAVSQPIESIDALGRRSSAKYDGLGRAVESTDAAGNKTQFAYDEVGNLLSLTDAAGNATRYKYNNMNQLVERTDPLGKSDYREYDLNGNLTAFTDRRGLKSTYTYDKQDRLTKTTYADGNTVQLIYDANDRVIEVQDSVSGVFNFSYDIMSNVTSQTGQTGTVRYQYDALNRMTKRQVVGQEALDYQYDLAGNLKAMAAPSASFTFDYDARNQLNQINRSNGVASKYAYDASGRLTKITHQHGADIISEQIYTLDSTGNRIKNKIDIAQALTTQTALAEVDTRSNRLLKYGDHSYTYDDNGNRLAATGPEGTTRYQWDARNRLEKLTKPDGEVITFTYDFGRNMLRQSRVNNGVTYSENYTLDLATNVVLQTNSRGEQISVLTADGIDTHLAAARNDAQVDFGLGDGINSTIATTNRTGAVKDKFFYEPFGGTTSTGDDYPFRYTGRTPIDASIYYYRARFYDATAAVFFSEDPIGFRGGDVNLYAYAAREPIGNRDPSGLETCSFGGYCNAPVAVSVNLRSPGDLFRAIDTHFESTRHLHLGKDDIYESEFRYIDGLDMRHVTAARNIAVTIREYLGCNGLGWSDRVASHTALIVTSYLGVVIEEIQAIVGSKSAFDPQDWKSNFEGAYLGAYEPDPLSNAGSH